MTLFIKYKPFIKSKKKKIKKTKKKIKSKTLISTKSPLISITTSHFFHSLIQQFSSPSLHSEAHHLTPNPHLLPLLEIFKIHLK